MAWVSPKVYAILKNSEEGKDILEGIAEKDQAEVDKEVEAFFGKGGKGEKDASAYTQAKMDDEAEENAYKSMSYKEVEQGSGNVEEDTTSEETKAIKSVLRSVGESDDFDGFTSMDETVANFCIDRGVGLKEISKSKEDVQDFADWLGISKKEAQDVIDFYVKNGSVLSNFEELDDNEQESVEEAFYDKVKKMFEGD